MSYKKFLIVLISFFLIAPLLYADNQNIPEAEQQINDFSIAGYGEKGKKTWELSAQTADVFNEAIRLKAIEGSLYGEKEDVKLTADKGDFDKAENKVHLEENVTVSTSSGSKLTTDTLDWDRKNQLVSTKDTVNIEKDDMVTTAQGATGEPNLNKITLEKDVTVKINPAQTQGEKQTANKNKITINCDGPVQIDYQKNIATFNNNVLVDNNDFQIYSDAMDIYFITSGTDNTSEKNSAPMGSKIDKIIARGNVKIVRGENISYSDEAVYIAAEKKITLAGKPKLVIYSTEDLNASFGN